MYKAVSTNVRGGDVKGSFTYLKRPFVLKYLEDNNKVFKIQGVRAPVVKDAAVIAYASQAANIPQSALLMVKNALFDAIGYFCTQGRRVMVPGLGSFAPVTRVKVVRTEEECDAATIKQKSGRVLRYFPTSKMRDLAGLGNVRMVENTSLSNMACGALAATVDGETWLVNSQGVRLAYGSSLAPKGFKKTGTTWGSADLDRNSAFVMVNGEMTDSANGVFQYGSQEYTLTQGVLTPEPGMY